MLRLYTPFGVRVEFQNKLQEARSTGMKYIMNALRDGMDIGTPRERRRVRGLPNRFRRRQGLQVSAVAKQLEFAFVATAAVAIPHG